MSKNTYTVLEQGKWSYKNTPSNIAAAKYHNSQQRKIKKAHADYAKKLKVAID